MSRPEVPIDPSSDLVSRSQVETPTYALQIEALNFFSLLYHGYVTLRRLRTFALTETNPHRVQRALQEAHFLAAQMAEEIVAMRLRKFTKECDNLLDDRRLRQDYNQPAELLRETVATLHDEYIETRPIANVVRNAATQLELTISTIVYLLMSEHTNNRFLDLTTLPRSLSTPIIASLLSFFMTRVNHLPTTEEVLFSPSTRIGGIITGGSIVLEAARVIAEHFGDSSISLNTFVVAVDRRTRKVVYETSELDQSTKTVLLVDETILTGETMAAAWRAMKLAMPNAEVKAWF